ncbi:MAG: MlaD family protein [Treponema sp.]|jgi:phospholipid/cholesterol/gamma-HCH transport system substrate-binding protein|nr:MlaD family protein [Treponema sp.]
MKFTIRFADKIVGTLVVIALAMLIVVIFMLGKNQRWFAKDYKYKSYFASAKGLGVNMAVQYKGFTIGNVKRIRLADDDMVEVDFTIFEEYHQRVREGSVVGLQVSPIGLGNTFMFYPGKGEKIMGEDSIIPEINSFQAAQLIQMGLAGTPVNDDSIGNIINQVTMLIETVNKSLGEILGDAEAAIGGVSDVIQNISGQLNPILNNVETLTVDLNTKVKPILTNVETLTDQLSAPSGTVMSILDNNGPVLSNITETLNSITSIMNSLEKTIEFVPAQLPQVAILLSDLHSALAEAEKMIIALNNNPLLRGGVPEQKETGPGAATPRDLDF